MKYPYVAEYTTYYAGLGLTVNPGDVVEWPNGAPADGRWGPAVEDAAPPKPTKRAAPASTAGE